MIFLRPRLGPKRLAALAHDLVMTALAIVVCYLARFGTAAFTYRLDEMAVLAAIILPAAAVVYLVFGLYSAVWRFASVPDLLSILKAVTTLAAIMAVLDFATRGGILVPRTIVFLFWFVAGALLAGPRLVFRSYRDRHLRTYGHKPDGMKVPALVLGTGRSAEVLIRSLETDPDSTIKPLGLLAMKSRHVGQRIRGVPILGTEEDLAAVARRLQLSAKAPLRLVVTDEALREQERVEQAVAKARSLGMTVERLAPVVEAEEGRPRHRLTEIDIADMRPRVRTDRRAFSALVAGRRVAVTGGGGVTGSEICRQAAAGGCSALLVVENAELALYECRRSLRSAHAGLAVETSLSDVRDGEAMEALFTAFKPDIVIHTAAMKHEATAARQLPMALSVNVGGTISAAAAAVAAGAGAMIFLSTDQAASARTAVGATKRLAELYLELLATEVAAAGGSPGIATQLVALRFANVYSARGPTVSAIRSQIARGGPVVLPAAGERGLLMALDDAVAEVLRSAAEALSRREAWTLLEVNLGRPVLLEDVAERMIRLSGLEPGEDVAVTARPPTPRLRNAAELETRVPALVERAKSDPNLALREILAISRSGIDADEVVARLARIPPAQREAGGTRLH